MISNNFTKNLSQEQEGLGLRIFDLIIDRILRSVYLGLDESGKKNMENIFISGTDGQKDEFIKSNIPDFKELFKKEGQKLEEEIKQEIEKQV